MIVSFSGVQGAGKSTLVSMMKKDAHFCNCVFHDEIVRKLHAEGLGINECGDDETQRRVMQAHVSNLSKRFSASVVVDRGILDGYVYSKYLFDNKKISKDAFQYTYTTFRNNYHLYDIVFYIRPEFDLVSDGVRSEDKKFRDSISYIFEDTIKKYNIEVVELSGSVEDRYATLFEAVMSKMYK